MRQLRQALGLLLLVIVASPVGAAPGDVLFSDDFEGGFGNWTETSPLLSLGDASIGNETANSPNSSMRLRWDEVTATSNTIDASVPAAELSLWIRRGSDSFSENPESGEDLILEFQDSGNNWVTLETFDGGGTPGEIFNRVYTLPADARHAGLQIRLTLEDGNGPDFDYWHVDDVVVTETEPPPPLEFGSCDDFESGFGNWTTSGSGDASIGTETANSPTHSMRLRWDTVTATSIEIDMNQPIGTLEVWIRRGHNSFSERPEGNENLVLEYLDNSNNWVSLETFSGSGSQGEIFNRSYNLPANALHSNFRIRFRLLSGSGSDFDYWHVDDVCLVDPLEAAYQMDEASWNGTADEVTDSSGNDRHGTAINGATTAIVNPAIPGSPGTCSYGTFDGSNDYVQVNNLSNILNGTASLAFWINTNQAGNDTGWQAPGVTGVEEAGGQDDIFWGWLDSAGRIGISVGNDFASDQKSTVAINDGNWHHVVLTRNASTGDTTIYIDGSLNQSGTTGTGTIGNTFSSIGRIEDTGGSPIYFNGLLDEIRIYDTVLNATAVTRIMNLTRPCPAVGPDHYAISHDGAGVTCLAEAVTITAHDAGHTALDPGNVTINLSTTTGRGDWSAIVAGSGILDNGTAGDGAASYTFPGGETSVTLAFNYTNIPSGDSEAFFFNVTDGAVGDLGDGSAEDPQMTFARTGFQFINQTDGNAIIPTQIAGKPSDIAPNAKNLALRAVRSSDNDPSVCVAEFANESKTLEFGAECRNPAVCAGQNFSLNGNAFLPNNDNGTTATSAYPLSATLNFDANGVAPLVLNYFDAGLMQLHVRYNIPLDDGSNTPSGDYMLGSSNAYVVRPFGFDINASGNPGAVDADGSVYTAAGTDFDVTATAVLWQQADDANNDGVPDGHETTDTDAGNNVNLSDNAATPNFGQEAVPATVLLTSRLDQPAAGNPGSLTGSTALNSFTNGGATGTLQYTEVGIVEIRGQTSDYLGGGQNATGTSGYVGRFIPYDFNISRNTPEFGTACTGGAQPFTYIGQPFTYNTVPVVTVTARALGGTTTENYIGDFFKLTADSLTVPGPAADKGYSALTGDLDLGMVPDKPTVTELGAGQGDLTFSDGGGIAFVRNAPEAPFDAEISLEINVIDEDGVVYGDGAGNDLNPVRVPASGSIDFDASPEQRWGRLQLTNVSGSELLSLSLPMTMEYFNGTAFVTNTDDSCTTLSLANDIELSNPQTSGGTPQPGTTTMNVGGGTSQVTSGDPVFSSGTASLVFSAPGENNTGYIDVLADLDGAGFSYLLDDRNEDGNYDASDNPNGRVTFGIYSGQREMIYIREPW